jgi:serine/threonine protein phosphatase PrpC
MVTSYQSFSVSVIGSSHTKCGKGIEDSASHCDYKHKLSLAVVADGHGADECFRSGAGAEIAAQCALRGMFDFAAKLEPRFTGNLLHKASPPLREELEGLLHGLVKHIIAQWHGRVDEDIKSRPFTEEELESAGEKYRRRYDKKENAHKAYGATLIACAALPSYWFGIHIGDGRLTALYEDGSFDQPVPWDDKCFLNQTTSICDDDAAERARVYVAPHTYKAPPAAVFLCSDGVDDNSPVDGNEQHLFKLYRTIALTFAEDGFESTFEQIKGLAGSFATKGKGDDTSIAGVIDMGAVRRAAPVWQEQIAREEAAG